MKKKLLYAFTLCFATPSFVSAQTNLDFESWTGTDPNGWETSNSITTPSAGAQTVFKLSTNPGEGISSVKMLTGSCPDCPNFTTLGFSTPLPNPMGGTLNMDAPYSLRPISVDFKYKANPMGNDICGFQVELIKYYSANDSTATIGEAYFETSIQVANWTAMNIPIVYYSTELADHISIFVTSSIGSIPDLSSFGIPNIFPVPTPVANSEFDIDAIHFNLPSCAGFSVTMSGTNESGITATDGTATATPNGGTGPYTYLWSDLSTNPSINGLLPGLYSVTVTDANGCSKVGTYNVLPFSCGAFSVSVTGTNATSFTSQDGTANATVSGGTGPYTYLWNTGETTASISGLRLGAYIVYVTDGSGNCSAWGYFPASSDIAGIENVISKSDILNVFPNPSTGLFTINLNSKEKTTIQVYDIVGKLVFSKETSITLNTIDLSSLGAGVYSLKTNSKNNISTIQIVITK